jgi:hypothetical protein
VTVETLSEALFKRHCEARGVVFHRIAEDGRKVADFELTLEPSIVVAEIKQLDPNDQDRAREAAMAEGQVGSGFAPTGRLRNLLGAAYRQIKPYALRGVPGLVVCYNNAGALTHIDNFTVTRAMFGGMAAYIALGQDGNIHHVGQGFTGQRKVTRNTCRGLSAVCVLSTPTNDTTRLVAYHNPYASNPISPAALRKLADRQFGYNDPHAGKHVQLLAHELEV